MRNSKQLLFPAVLFSQPAATDFIFLLYFLVTCGENPGRRAAERFSHESSGLGGGGALTLAVFLETLVFLMESGPLRETAF